MRRFPSKVFTFAWPWFVIGAGSAGEAGSDLRNTPAKLMRLPLERLHHVHGFGWHYAPPFGRSPRSQRGSVTCGLAASPTRMAVFAALGPLWPVQPPHLPNREACEKRHGHAP